MPYDICHIELNTTDPAASKAFLGELFGWEFQDMGPEYAVFSAPEGPGGGLETVKDSQGPGDIRIYVHVPSIEECLAKATGMGGSVVKPKTEIGGGHGYYAQLCDPGGTVLGVWQAAD